MQRKWKIKRDFISSDCIQYSDHNGVIATINSYAIDKVFVSVLKRCGYEIVNKV